MGYRSDFVLIIHGNGNQNSLAKLWVWLHAKAEEENGSPNRRYSYSGWYSYLIENVYAIRSVPEHDYIYWMDDSIKLYGFEEVRAVMLQYAEEVLDLEWEYTSIGEETDDIVETASAKCDRRSWVSRSIVVN